MATFSLHLRLYIVIITESFIFSDETEVKYLEKGVSFYFIKMSVHCNTYKDSDLTINIYR